MENLILFTVLMLLGLLFGSAAEKKHLKSLNKREQQLKNIVLSNKGEKILLDSASKSALVTGHTVVALDYFKRFAAILVNLIGGRVKTYESLIMRARREAIIRAKEKAAQAGYNAIINLKIETSNIGGSAGSKGGLGAIEVIAYGTAIKK